MQISDGWWAGCSAVAEQEHALYPQALRLLAAGKLVIEGQRVRIN